jgi:hypothetical protein
MFPNSDYGPPLFSQRSCYQTVTATVCRELLFPKLSIIYRNIRVFWAAMPKTSVHEYGDALLAKYKIRFSKNWLVPPPALNAMFPKELCKRDLCFFVTASAN